jgi:hypothetical protein
MMAGLKIAPVRVKITRSEYRLNFWVNNDFMESDVLRVKMKRQSINPDIVNVKSVAHA